MCKSSLRVQCTNFDSKNKDWRHYMHLEHFLPKFPLELFSFCMLSCWRSVIVPQCILAMASNN